MDVVSVFAGECKELLLYEFTYSCLWIPSMQWTVVLPPSFMTVLRASLLSNRTSSGTGFNTQSFQQTGIGLLQMNLWRSTWIILFHKVLRIQHSLVILWWSVYYTTTLRIVAARWLLKHQNNLGLKTFVFESHTIVGNLEFGFQQSALDHHAWYAG